VAIISLLNGRHSLLLIVQLITIQMVDRPNLVKSISELHRILGCGKPKHPAISLIHTQDIQIPDEVYGQKLVFDFYAIYLKEKVGEMKYGHNYYDFEEGTLLFTAPGQVITPLKRQYVEKQNGWSLYFHPDLLRVSGFAQRIKQYSFFSYTSNEALHVSDDEKATLYTCVSNIEKEYSSNIDRHSQGLIVSNIELLLNYCTRFYDRQFITRSYHHKDIITRFEQYLSTYYIQNAELKSLPTVAQCAQAVNLSPHYLSDLLRKETGKSAQEHIHHFIIDEAKTKLLATADSISEIAFQLGFEYPAYFTKMFKSKTGTSPLEFRNLN
jgi:AraC family transcriptional regulator, transcriptional activator of pobA